MILINSTSISNSWLRISHLQRIWSRSSWALHGRTSCKPKVPLSKTAPRPHFRRVMEAVAEPVLPDDPEFILQRPAAVRCQRPAFDVEQAERLAQLTTRQLAQRSYLRKHLLDAMVVIVCHEHPTDARTQHYEIMEMAANGVAFARLQEAKIIRSTLQGTSLETLIPFFDDDVETLTSIMFVKRFIKEHDDGRSDIISGKVRDGNYFALALRYAKSTKWIIPLAVAYEDRILTFSEAELLESRLRNPLQVRGETVALLNLPASESVRLLNQHSLSLTSSLQSREEQLKNDTATADQKPS